MKMKYVKTDVFRMAVKIHVVSVEVLYIDSSRMVNARAIFWQCLPFPKLSKAAGVSSSSMQCNVRLRR